MALGVKLLMLGAALTGVSCGSYVVYKNVSGSTEEKTKEEKTLSVDTKNGTGTDTGAGSGGNPQNSANTVAA